MKPQTLKKHIKKFGEVNDNIEAFDQIIREMNLMVNGMSHVMEAFAENADLTQAQMQEMLDQYFFNNNEHDMGEE